MRVCDLWVRTFFGIWRVGGCDESQLHVAITDKEAAVRKHKRRERRRRLQRRQKIAARLIRSKGRKPRPRTPRTP